MSDATTYRQEAVEAAAARLKCSVLTLEFHLLASTCYEGQDHRLDCLALNPEHHAAVTRLFEARPVGDAW